MKNRIWQLTSLTFIWLMLMGAVATQVHTFVDGDVLTSAQLNAEFGNLYSTINSLDNANIAASAQIDPEKLDPTLAGNGLSRNGTTKALEVNTDGVTCEISSDAIRVKDGGISLAKMASDSVNSAKIVDASVALADMASDSVNAAKIVDASVGADELAANSVGSSEIQTSVVASTNIVDATIVAADIATAGVGSIETSFTRNSDTLTTTCTSSGTTVDCGSFTLNSPTTDLIMVSIQPDNDTNSSYIYTTGASATTCEVKIDVDGTDEAVYQFSGVTGDQWPTSFVWIGAVTAGTVTVTAQIDRTAGTGTCTIYNADIIGVSL